MTTSTNVTSTNWSGAVITAASGKSFSDVSAEWVVPTVSQVPSKSVTTSDVSEWVGIDGYNSSDVCQAGIQETVQTGSNGQSTVSISAWTEWYPAGSQTISSSALKINAGDTIKVTVETTGAGANKATFIFDDVTTNKTYTTSLTAPSGTKLTGNSAEVVVETPEIISGNKVSQPLLADFLSTPVTFNDIAATYSNGASASLSSAQSIGMVSNAVPGDIGTYVQEAYGSVNASGDSVSVTEDDYWGSASTSSSTVVASDDSDQFNPWGHHHGWF